MRAVVTRVSSASVQIDGETVGRIGTGFLILLGITHEDTEALGNKLADKIISLRIFEDESGKFNRSLQDVNGEILIVSQFIWKVQKGTAAGISICCPARGSDSAL